MIALGFLISVRINYRICHIEEKLNQVDEIDNKADKALAKSIESSHRIDRLTSIQNWLIGILISGIGITILIYIIEKFL